MLEINLAKAKELISLAVEEKGADYVYPFTECQYTLGDIDEYYYNDTYRMANPEAPRMEEIPTLTIGCGVGLALLKGGISLEDQKPLIGDAIDALNELRSCGLTIFTEAGARYLLEFQRKQDREQSWGSSQDDADIYVTGGEFDDTRLYTASSHYYRS